MGSTRELLGRPLVKMGVGQKACPPPPRFLPQPHFHPPHPHLITSQDGVGGTVKLYLLPQPHGMDLPNATLVFLKGLQWSVVRIDTLDHHDIHSPGGFNPLIQGDV